MQNNNFTKTDEGGFAASFITINLAEMASLRRVDSITAANLLGRKPTAREDLSGILFTYFFPGDPNPRDYRIRLDNPLKDNKGKVIAKYLGSFGAKPKIYFPPGVTLEMLADVNLPIIFTEGEKKGLSLFRVATNNLTETPRFLPLALQGVYNWNERHKDAKREMADFHSITWPGRKTTILFDADVADNYKVAHARTLFAKHLKTKQAKVFICSMPKVEVFQGGGK